MSRGIRLNEKYNICYYCNAHCKKKPQILIIDNQKTLVKLCINCDNFDNNLTIIKYNNKNVISRLKNRMFICCSCNHKFLVQLNNLIYNNNYRNYDIVCINCNKQQSMSIKFFQLNF